MTEKYNQDTLFQSVHFFQFSRKARETFQLISLGGEYYNIYIIYIYIYTYIYIYLYLYIIYIYNIYNI